MLDYIDGAKITEPVSCSSHGRHRTRYLVEARVLNF
jgi:hypothetical protein